MENERIAIIDGDSLIFSAFHPNKILDENGIPKRTEDNSKFLYQEKTEEEVIASCDWLLKTILVNSRAEGYILFIKGKNTISSKLKVNPNYKQDRPKEPPKHWHLCKNHYMTKYNAIEVNGCETDDYCNITRLQIPNSFMCAIDSDVLGLEGTHFNWRTNQWITTTKEQAEYKFWSDMVCGTHNATKGLVGKGKKFIDKLFESNEQYEESKLEIVFNTFIQELGEFKGIQEFYSNYFCIKILEQKEDFILPEIQEFKI